MANTSTVIIPFPWFIVFLLIFISCCGFIIWSVLESRRKLVLLQTLYIGLCLAMALWCMAMMGLYFTDMKDVFMQYFWDSLSYLGATSLPVLVLFIAITFVRGINEVPKSWKYLFVLPVLTNLLVWTNPVHHLHYKVFSIFRDQLVFGPNLIFHGIFSYICIIYATFLLVQFYIRQKDNIFRSQCLLLIVGNSVPLLVSIMATVGLFAFPIYATPLSFAISGICTFFAISKYKIINLQPVATQMILDNISDSYFVINIDGVLLSENERFTTNLKQVYGIRERVNLDGYLSEMGDKNVALLYNLINAVQSSKDSKTVITYEQDVIVEKENESQKIYYFVEVNPLFSKENLLGYVIIFKDFTPVKKSMQQLQENQTRMMEQERLASIGQMVGGLAHNLKTPIMSIAGCSTAIDTLVREIEESVENSTVTVEDYHQICSEMYDWLSKIKESCGYMSDIITIIKGQAANAGGAEQAAFTIQDLITRSTMLMRHELLYNRCEIVSEYDSNTQYTLTGDINNLIQVLNNLISNAIDATSMTGGGKIEIGIDENQEYLDIYVKDTGPGINPNVKRKLFNEMTTTKGVKGTGIGLFISNAVVRGKFGGNMWAKDNPEGGAIFGLSIPIELVKITNYDISEEIDEN
jgi:two-component system, NtrC family, sensor histidine kinase HupT/HoxJ